MERITQAIQSTWDSGKLGEGLKLTSEQLIAFQTHAEEGFSRQWLEPPQEPNWLRPSGWNCARKKAYIKLHPELATAFNFRVNCNFYFGDVVENWITSLALAAGVPLKHVGAKQLTLSTVLGDGHPDGIIAWDDAPHELLEVKKLSGYGFRELKKAQTIREFDDEFGYRTQVSAYADGAIKAGLIDPAGPIRIIGVKLDPIEILEKVFVYDKQLIESRTAEAKKIEKATDVTELPVIDDAIPGVATKLRAACQFCPFMKSCWEAEGVRLTERFERGRMNHYIGG